jgi:predicted ATPase
MPSPRGSTNLTPAATSFVGRERALRELGELAEAHALITLVGCGGIGKTRLATEFARGRGKAFAARGGVWFCDLAQATTATHLASALGAVLEVSLVGSDSDAVAQLGVELARRGPLLMVLDNFEQLTHAAAETVGRWLAAAPEARFLATSREPLGLAGEMLFDLDPLSLPGAASDLGDSDAARLFVERTRALRRGYVVDEAEAEDVAAIVKRVDGLPLAIELAAARMRVLSTRQLLAELSSTFDLLRSAHSDVPTRHATIEAAIAWSWERLLPWERAALAQCAVFRGGFTLEATRSVLDLGDRDALDGVQALVDRSLVSVEHGPGNDAPRFRLFESIRAFASKKLEGAARTDVEERHARHYLELTRFFDEGDRRAAPPSASARDEALRELGVELDNLVEVHRRALAARPLTAEGVGYALRVAFALEALIARRGPMSLRHELFNACLEASTHVVVDPRLVARALLGRASASADLGHPVEARSDAEAALKSARAADEPRLLGEGLTTLARIDWNQGRIEQAREGFAGALASFERAGDEQARARAMFFLGNALYVQGAIEEARDLYAGAIPLLAVAADRAHHATALSNLAGALSDLGNLDEAARRGEAALALQREVGNRYGEANTVMNLGIVAVEQREFERARARLAESTALHRAIGNRASEAISLVYEGLARECGGDAEEAKRLYLQAIAMQRDTGNAVFKGIALAYLARVLAREGDVGAAEQSLDEAETALEAAGPTLVGAVVTLVRGEIALTLGAIERDRGVDPEASLGPARAALDRASHRGDSMPPPGASGRPRLSPVERSSDVRLARDLLRERLEAFERAEDAPGKSSETGVETSARVLVIGPAARWFQLAEGKRADLKTRSALRLLLQALAEHWRARRAAALGVSELLEAGWPGEVVQVEAGASRVYAALSMLRNLGLRQVLVRRDDGYLLDPAVVVEMRTEDRD